MAENDAGGSGQDDMEIDAGAGDESAPEDDPAISRPSSPPPSDSDSSDLSEDDEDNEDE